MSSTKTLEATKEAQIKSSQECVATTKTWSINNVSGTALVVIDAYNNDPSSIAELYESSLQLLSTTDGAQSVKAGEVKGISLGEAHLDGDGNPVDYTIIIARADNLFPVKIVELPMSGTQESFPATTVTSNDASLMKKAETFQQTIIAFPSSEMTTRYADVLSAPDEQKLSAFFKSYPQYGDINLDHVTAVQTYYNRYDFVWAGYAGNISYYLYTSNGTNKKISGTVSIINKVITPVTSPEAPEGFTATYTDLNHRNTVLYYANGQFSDDVNSSSPKICLQGSFQLKSELTGVDTDNLIVTSLYGVVNDTEVIGYADKDFPVDKKSGKSGIDALLDPQSITDKLTLAGLAAAALAVVVGLAVAARLIVKAIRKGPALTPEEIRRRTRHKAKDALSRLDPEQRKGLKIPDDLNVAIDRIKREATENILRNNKERLIEIQQRHYEICEKLLEYGSSSSIEKIIEDGYEEGYILEGDAKYMGGEMKGLVESISKHGRAINDRISSLGKKLSKADAETIAESKKIAEESMKRVINNEKVREDLREDEIPEIIVEE